MIKRRLDLGSPGWVGVFLTIPAGMVVLVPCWWFDGMVVTDLVFVKKNYATAVFEAKELRQKRVTRNIC